MNELHEHPGCTLYIHELLDIIETSMIVLLSQKKDRIRSGPLLEKLEAMHGKIEDLNYSQIPCPEKRDFYPPIGVEAKLNEHAMVRINGPHGPLDVYKRRTAIPLTTEQLKQIDTKEENNPETLVVR
jgi:hypothetical protein